MVAAIALGSGVSLLGRDPAVLDREARHVAGRIDVVDPDDPAVVVDGDESIRVAGNPGYPRAFELRHRDNVVGRDRALTAQVKLPGGVVGHLGGCDELDLSFGQQLGELIARSGGRTVQVASSPA